MTAAVLHGTRKSNGCCRRNRNSVHVRSKVAHEGLYRRGVEDPISTSYCCRSVGVITAIRAAMASASFARCHPQRTDVLQKRRSQIRALGVVPRNKKGLCFWTDH